MSVAIAYGETRAYQDNGGGALQGRIAGWGASSFRGGCYYEQSWKLTELPESRRTSGEGNAKWHRMRHRSSRLTACLWHIG